jgi:hypothetical protein
VASAPHDGESHSGRWPARGLRRLEFVATHRRGNEPIA